MSQSELVIGTAGHIDHGKTTLIQAITGTDTDHLKEEKQRGMTLELGFAFYPLDEHRTLSFIDVPGHEKLIKTMVSGAIGIDGFLLLVAADEGIMPQTIEHLTILSALNIKIGAVVISKCDRVDTLSKEKVLSDVKQLMKEFEFDDESVAYFYFEKGQAIDPGLIHFYDKVLRDKRKKSLLEKGRMNIDRVFTLKGLGTVVTGTLMDGSIEKNETLILYPQGLKTRVKNIQCHHRDVKKAFPGQRVALNITSDYQSVHRGDVISNDLTLMNTRIIDVKMKSYDSDLKHGDRIRLLIGTREVFGRAVIHESGETDSQGMMILKLRLESEITCKSGDYFILRRFSPVTMIGGGRVIHPLADKYHMIEDVNHAVMSFLNQNYRLFSCQEFNYSTHFKSQELYEDFLEKQCKSGDLIQLDDQYYMTRVQYEALQEQLIKKVGDYHQKRPLTPGLSKATLKSLVFPKLSKDQYELILEQFIAQNNLKYEHHLYSLPQFKITYTPEERAIEERIKQLINHEANGMISIKLIFDNIGHQKSHYDIFNNLLIDSFLVKINEETVMNMIFYQQCLASLKDFLKKNQKITVAEYRDLLKRSRKQSIMLLEHFDSIKVTKRIENYRILRK